MIFKSILIVSLLCLLVWIPFFLNIYTSMVAVVLTISFIVAGLIGERYLNKNKGKE